MNFILKLPSEYVIIQCQFFCFYYSRLYLLIIIVHMFADFPGSEWLKGVDLPVCTTVWNFSVNTIE